MIQLRRHTVIPAGIMDMRVRAPASAAGNGLLNSLIAYWPLNEAGGAKNALDLHTNGLTLTQTASPGSAETGSVDADIDAIRLITDAIDTSAVTITSTNNAGVLTFTKGVTFNATVSSLTISDAWAKMYFTLKESDYDTDEMALIQLVVTNPAAALTTACSTSTALTLRHLSQNPMARSRYLKQAVRLQLR